jgi:hypothetical protein
MTNEASKVQRLLVFYLRKLLRKKWFLPLVYACLLLCLAVCTLFPPVKKGSRYHFKLYPPIIPNRTKLWDQGPYEHEVLIMYDAPYEFEVYVHEVSYFRLFVELGAFTLLGLMCSFAMHWVRKNRKIEEFVEDVKEARAGRSVDSFR